MIDTHLHTWKLGRSTYHWLTDDLPIARDMLDIEAIAASQALGFTEHILVQADDTVADTDWMLEVAAQHPTVVGVVAWVPLTDVDCASAVIASWDSRIVGVRALVHVHDDPHLLERPSAAAVATKLAAAGLPLDVPDAYPAFLPQASALARQVTGLTVVLDHLGKPPADRSQLSDWKRQIADFAAIETTVAKLSGLHHGGVPLPTDTLRDVWDTALEYFGPTRLMLGSDWPMPLLHEGQTGGGVLGLLSELTDSERDAIESGTARRVYLGRR